MGNSFIFQNQNALPNGKTCVLTGYVHAQLVNTATVTDVNNNTVAQISGSGGTTGGYVPMSSPSGKTNSFVVQSSAQPYTITFTNSSGNPQSQFLYAQDAISSGTTAYAQSYTFVTEDATDNDYNDATVYLTWNLTSS